MLAFFRHFPPLQSATFAEMQNYVNHFEINSVGSWRVRDTHLSQSIFFFHFDVVFGKQYAK